ncbi:MAG: hypothetical protein IJ889_05390 [Eubacterium sp.]|nr:hypothetical protein [Eubacterium sp.]
MKKVIGLSIVTIVFAFALVFFAKGNMAKAAPEQTTTKVPETTTHKKQPAKKISLSTPKLKIKKHYEKHIRLDWNSVDKAQSYRVLRAQKGQEFTLIKKTAKSAFTDKKAKKRKTYRYKIVAEAKSGGKTFTSKESKTKSVYVLPKNPRVVICGECFVEGMKLYAKKYKPKNSYIISKIGISTSGMLNDNYINYKGRSITAIERIAYYNPDRVYFLIGMNEAKGGNPSSTVKNYKKAFKLLKSINPHIEMVLMALPPVGRSHSSGFASNPKINRYNRAYKKYASKTKNVFYYSRYRKLISDGAGYLKANGGDGGHWSSGGTIKVVKDLKKHSKSLTKR